MLKSFFPGPAFTAETLTSAMAGKTVPPLGHGYSGALYCVWGTYKPAANVEDGDIFEMRKCPANFLALWGWLALGDMDTGTEALDMDAGWAANGGGSETFTAPWGTVFTNAAATASPTGFVNSGVLSGDGVTDLMAAGTNYRPFILPKPLLFTRPTMFQIEANAAANAFASVDMTLAVVGQIIG